MNRLPLLALLLSGCVTSTTTFPDGKTIVTRRHDAELAKAIGSAVAQAAVVAAKAELERREQEGRR